MLELGLHVWWWKHPRMPMWWVGLNSKSVWAGVIFFCLKVAALCIKALLFKKLKKQLFKVFIELVTVLLPLYVLLFWLQGKWDLSSPTGDEIGTPCARRWSLNHWTSRDIPSGDFCLWEAGPRQQPRVLQTSFEPRERCPDKTIYVLKWI